MTLNSTSFYQPSSFQKDYIVNSDLDELLTCLFIQGHSTSSSDMVNDLDLGPRLVKLCLQNMSVAGFSNANATCSQGPFGKE
jgi:hypothetical protein